MRTFSRIKKNCITDTVLRFEINIIFKDRQFFARRSGRNSAKTGCQRQRDKVAS